MTAGDLVVYVTDPLDCGKMLILDVVDGWYLCEAVHPDNAGEYYRDRFRAAELMLYETWASKPAAA